MFRIEDARKKYIWQKKRAKQRNIPFLITFEEWCNLWLSSGKWDQRGNKKGQYVMSRYNDIGPYAIDNVTIITTESNLSQGNVGKKITEDTKLKMRLSNQGKKKPPTIISCVHCDKQGAKNLINRWHNDNCKERSYV